MWLLVDRAGELSRNWMQLQFCCSDSSATVDHQVPTASVGVFELLKVARWGCLVVWQGALRLRLKKSTVKVPLSNFFKVPGQPLPAAHAPACLAIQDIVDCFVLVGALASMCTKDCVYV